MLLSWAGTRGCLSSRANCTKGGITAVYIQGDFVSLVVKERMEDAVRYAEQRRALRLARRPCRPARLRLGMALVQFGHWIMGQYSPAPETPIGLRQTQS